MPRLDQPGRHLQREGLLGGVGVQVQQQLDHGLFAAGGQGRNVLIEKRLEDRLGGQFGMRVAMCLARSRANMPSA
jgi:hypothetical protein